MKKRLLALVLVLVMAVGLITACGKKTANNDLGSWDTLREMQKVQKGKFSVELNFKGKGLSSATASTVATNQYEAIAEQILSDLSVKLDGSVVSTKEAKFNIQYKLADAKDYTSVTDIVLKDEAVYINLKTLREMLQSVNDPQVAMIAGLLTSDKDYIKVTMDDVTALAKQYGLQLDTTQLSISEDMDKVGAIIMDKVVTLLEKSTDGVKPAVVSEKDGKYSITVNNDNAVQFLDKLKSVLDKDGEALITEGIDEIKKLDGDHKAIIDQYESMKSSIASASTSLESAKKTLKEDKNTKFNFGLDYSLEGKEGKRKAAVSYNINVKASEKEQLDMTMKTTTEEGKEEAVKAPESAVSLTDFVSALMSSLGQ